MSTFSQDFFWLVMAQHRGPAALLQMLFSWLTPWHLLNRPVFWLMICSSGKKRAFEANLVWLCLTYILLTNQHFWSNSADAAIYIAPGTSRTYVLLYVVMYLRTYRQGNLDELKQTFVTVVLWNNTFILPSDKHWKNTNMKMQKKDKIWGSHNLWTSQQTAPNVVIN